jgi:phosphoglucosamine mutase
LKATVNCNFSGLRVAVDCANGAASEIVQQLFQGLGGEFEIINAFPDGLNINKDCGSMYMENLCKFVKENGCDIGFAFDGDADRCLAVDEKGSLIEGDKLIAIFADSLKKSGKLKSNTAVVTVLSNLGFFKFAEKHGIDVITASVGDRYVLEEMVNGGSVIGGENSGHIIFLDYATTGDGELTALQLLAELKNTGKKASELAAVMDTYPQVMVNVVVIKGDKNAIIAQQDVIDAVELAEGELAGDGRIIVRCSGTEPLIRIMVEGKSDHLIEKLASDIASVVKLHI